MKKLFFALAMLFIAVSAVQAQTPAETAAEAQETIEGPAMKFEEEILDYGTIEQNADPYRVFKFTNNGSEPLVIKSAKGSCGCTVPTVPEAPVMPGESAEIKVRYDTKRIGKFTKTVTLITNAKPERKVLTIKGEVKKEVEGVPTKQSNMLHRGGNGGN